MPLALLESPASSIVSVLDPRGSFAGEETPAGGLLVGFFSFSPFGGVAETLPFRGVVFAFTGDVDGSFKGVRTILDSGIPSSFLGVVLVALGGVATMGETSPPAKPRPLLVGVVNLSLEGVRLSGRDNKFLTGPALSETGDATPTFEGVAFKIDLWAFLPEWGVLGWGSMLKTTFLEGVSCPDLEGVQCDSGFLGVANTEEGGASSGNRGWLTR